MGKRKYSLSVLAAIVVMAISYGIVHALPYAPGETLDPTCAPGSTNCTVSSPLFVTPQMYGAVGNNSTDDTNAVQSCLNAVSTSVECLIPPAIGYKITATLIFDRAGILEGSGSAGKLIPSASMTGPVLDVKKTSNSNSNVYGQAEGQVLNDVWITGWQGATRSTASGILLEQLDRFTSTNVHVESLQGYCMHLGSNSGPVRESHLTNTRLQWCGNSTTAALEITDPSTGDNTNEVVFDGGSIESSPYKHLRIYSSNDQGPRFIYFTNDFQIEGGSVDELGTPITVNDDLVSIERAHSIFFSNITSGGNDGYQAGSPVHAGYALFRIGKDDGAVDVFDVTIENAYLGDYTSGQTGGVGIVADGVSDLFLNNIRFGALPGGKLVIGHLPYNANPATVTSNPFNFQVSGENIEFILTDIIGDKNVYRGEVDGADGQLKILSPGGLDIGASGALRGLSASGTNTPGGNLVIQSGLATGNAVTGNIVFQGATTGASGIALQTPVTYMTILGGGSGAGNVGINTTNPQASLDVNGSSVIIEQSNTPASSSAACTKGTISWDSGYVYVCVAANTWERSALSTW